MFIPRLFTDTAVQSLMTTDLNALNNGVLKVSSQTFSSTAGQFMTSGIYDNSKPCDPFADVALAITYASAPTAGTKVAELYILPTVDGTNYAAIDAQFQAQLSLLVATFESRNPSTTVLEYLIAPGISLPPGLFKWIVKNTSGQNFGATGNSLKMRPYKR